MKIFAFFILIFAFCIITNAYAHKVNIYAYAENGMVHSDSYFVDGTKCKNSIVEVFDEKSGTKLLEGKTDEDGKFSFKIPKTTPLKLVLHASMGHQAEYTLGEDEVKEATGAGKALKTPAVKPPVRLVDRPPAKISEKAPAGVSEIRGLSESAIEAIVESAVEKKLQPVMRMLAELREKSESPGITEIIGGIGYIIGILGIIAYFKAKKVRKD
ncbi:MAG: hypothetical protein AB1478_07145 [Nitrospirota bacterium]